MKRRAPLRFGKFGTPFQDPVDLVAAIMLAAEIEPRTTRSAAGPRSPEAPIDRAASLEGSVTGASSPSDVWVESVSDLVVVVLWDLVVWVDVAVVVREDVEVVVVVWVETTVVSVVSRDVVVTVVVVVARAVTVEDDVAVCVEVCVELTVKSEVTVEVVKAVTNVVVGLVTRVVNTFVTVLVVSEGTTLVDRRVSVVLVEVVSVGPAPGRSVAIVSATTKIEAMMIEATKKGLELIAPRLVRMTFMGRPLTSAALGGRSERNTSPSHP